MDLCLLRSLNSHYTKGVQIIRSQKHFRGEAHLSYGPTAQSVSVLMTLIRGRFCTSAEDKKLLELPWIPIRKRKTYGHCKHCSFLPAVPLICAIYLASLVRERYEHLHIKHQLVLGRFNKQTKNVSPGKRFVSSFLKNKLHVTSK